MEILKIIQGYISKNTVLRFNLLFVFIVIFLPNQKLFAEPNMTIKQIEQKEEKDKVFDMLKEAETILNRMSRQWQTDCIKAIGYEPFCSCVGKEIPSAWSFSDYIAITVKSKQENKYQNLDKKGQSAYDLVFKVRDKCVQKINDNPNN